MPLSDAKFLNNEEYPLSIRLSGLTGQSLSPSEYKQLVELLAGSEPTSTSTEGMIAPPAWPAGDPEFDRKTYERYKNYVLGKLKEQGITEGQPSPSDPEVNIQPNTPQQPSSTLPLSSSSSYTSKYLSNFLSSNREFSVPLGGIAFQELLNAGKHKDITDQISNLFSTSNYTEPGFDEKRKNLYLQALDRLADDPSINTSGANFAREQWTGQKPQEKVVMDIKVGDDPAAAAQKEQEAQDQYLEGSKPSTPLTEEEIYQQEKNQLLEQAEKNISATQQPSSSSTQGETAQAPNFQNLVNEVRQEELAQTSTSPSTSDAVEQKAQSTQEAFQEVVNNARQNDTQVAGAPALAIPLGLGVGAAILTGVGVKEGGQALQNVTDNIQELLTPSANVPDRSPPNPIIEKLQDAAPTVMGIFGLGKKNTTTGKPKATYEDAGLSPEEKANRQRARNARQEYERTFGRGSLDRPVRPPSTPSRGRGMGDTWEGPQSNVSPGERSQTIAQASTSTPSRAEVRAESSSSSPSASRSASRSNAFQSAVNSRRSQRSAFG
jgi:hypothetical protein